MKNLTKRIIAIAALLCVAVSGLTSCGGVGKSKDDSQQTTEEKVLQFPFEVGQAKEEDIAVADEENADVNGEDPTQAAQEETEDSTEVQNVTEADGSVVTTVQKVTDAKGAVVTNANGEEVTTVAEVTTVVKGSNYTANGNSNSNTTASNYTPKTDGKYAMWLDISKDENFVFNGEFIHVQFKIKDDVPNGDYKVRISPDLSDVAGKTVNPGKVTDGIIRVNNGSIDAVDSSDTTENYYYGDNVACKQGDTIDYYINVKNNSGLVAFCVWFYYDSNAMEVITAEPTGEFEEIARQAEFGGKQ